MRSSVCIVLLALLACAAVAPSFADDSVPVDQALQEVATAVVETLDGPLPEVPTSDPVPIPTHVPVPEPTPEPVPVPHAPKPEKCSKLGPEYHTYCSKKCVKQFECGKCTKGQVVDDFLQNEKKYWLPAYSNDIQGGCKGVACVPLYYNASIKTTEVGTVHFFLEANSDKLVISIKMECPFLVVPGKEKPYGPWLSIGIKDGKYGLPSSDPSDWQYNSITVPGYYSGYTFAIPLKKACAWGSTYNYKKGACPKTVNLAKSKYISIAVSTQVQPTKFHKSKPYALWDYPAQATFHSKAKFCESSPYFKLNSYKEPPVNPWNGYVTLALPYKSINSGH